MFNNQWTTIKRIWTVGWGKDVKYLVALAPNSDWFTVWLGLLSLQQVRVEGECFYFFCFFTFIHFPFCPVPLSFVSSTISSISPFSLRRDKMTHKRWRVFKLLNQSRTHIDQGKQLVLNILLYVFSFTSRKHACIEIYKKYQNFLSEKFYFFFLVIKFSVYLKRLVYVMTAFHFCKYNNGSNNDNDTYMLQGRINRVSEVQSIARLSQNSFSEMLGLMIF